jgi:DNA-binding NtrC family response regulator
MPARVLLIDDDTAGLRALSQALEPRLDDVAIDTAQDSHAALDFLRDWEYGVVVSDIRMPGMDGLALLNQVRERWPDVPVILMTAMAGARKHRRFTMALLLSSKSRSRWNASSLSSRLLQRKRNCGTV